MAFLHFAKFAYTYHLFKVIHLQEIFVSWFFSIGMVVEEILKCVKTQLCFFA